MDVVRLRALDFCRGLPIQGRHRGCGTAAQKRGRKSSGHLQPQRVENTLGAPLPQSCYIRRVGRIRVFARVPDDSSGCRGLWLQRLQGAIGPGSSLAVSDTKAEIEVVQASLLR
jgi:hypothetical protein